MLSWYLWFFFLNWINIFVFHLVPVPWRKVTVGFFDISVNKRWNGESTGIRRKHSGYNSVYLSSSWHQLLLQVLRAAQDFLLTCLLQQFRSTTPKWHLTQLPFIHKNALVPILLKNVLTSKTWFNTCVRGFGETSTSVSVWSSLTGTV